MTIPDPNTFRGPVQVGHSQSEDWEDVPLAFPENARMIGVVDMVKAIRDGRPHRASGAQAFHVLEVMSAFDKSSESGQHIEIQSTVERPAPFPVGLKAWEVD